MKSSQLIAAITCLFLMLISAGCTDPTETTSEQPTPTTAQNTTNPSSQNLTVYFLDVGQGDMTMTHHILR